MMEHVLELAEPYAVPDTYVSGLAEVEEIGGGCYRFVLYALHKHGGREERQVVARIVMTAEAIPAAMHMTAKATHSCACEAARMAKDRH